ALGQELLDIFSAPGADTSLNILRDVGPAHRVRWLIPHLRSAGEPPLHIQYTAGPRRVTAVTGHHRFDQITAPLKGRNLSRCTRYCGGERHKSHDATIKHDSISVLRPNMTCHRSAGLVGDSQCCSTATDQIPCACRITSAACSPITTQVAIVFPV